MKFSAIIAISTLAVSVSSLPLQMAYRAHNSYQARDVLPSGHPYPRAAAPEAMATPIPEVPESIPVTDPNAPGTSNPAVDTYNQKENGKRMTARQRRDAIRARAAAVEVYEREAEPEPEASPEADAEAEDDEEDILLDDRSRAALLRRLIEAEEEAVEKRADEYIRSFRFHRRASDYAY